MSRFLNDVAGERFSTATAPWTPETLGEALIAWWCADDHGTELMTDDGDGVISSWKDRVAELEVVAATTARPTWAAASFNSAHAGLTFDGVANCMTMAALDGDIPAGANPSTVVAVVAPANVSAAIVSYGANGAATRRDLVKVVNSGLRVNDASSILQVQEAANWTGPGIAVGMFEASQVTAWRSGSLIGTDGGGSLNTTTTRMRFGAAATNLAASFLNGVLRHVFILAGALAATLREQLEGWCAWDAGMASMLPANHPFKTGRP